MNTTSKIKAGKNKIIIEPDACGQIPLTKVTEDVRDLYVAKVDPDGVITLTPSVIVEGFIKDAFDREPEVLQAIEEFLASGEKAQPSEFWEKVILPTIPPEERSYLRELCLSALKGGG